MNRGRGRGRGRARDGGGAASGFHRGRSSPSHGYSPNPHVPVRADGSSFDAPIGSEDEFPALGRQRIGKMAMGTQKESLGMSNSDEQQNCPLAGIEHISSETEKIKLGQKLPNSTGHSPKQQKSLSAPSCGFKKNYPSSAHSDPNHKQRNIWGSTGGQTSHGDSGSCNSLDFDGSPVVETVHMRGGSSMVAESSVVDGPPKQDSETGKSFPEKTSGEGSSEKPEHSAVGVPYDICPDRTGPANMLKPSLLKKNREKRNEDRRLMEGKKISVLRSGMVLLKGYLDLNNQVKIVKLCRELGLGSGGFYQPGYRDGAKLNLKMMCLGKNWDPETSMYGDQRPIDGAKPPNLPSEFYGLVGAAIQDSHAFLKKHYETQIVDKILPSMQPNICIANFYTNSGKLGLHQDKDESVDSLFKGLPVVSFSIGDSADFLYGDTRDIEKAEKVVLESGDVLIFGGKSRHVFHGVTAIHPDSAPKTLLEGTNLRAGRLNLTFREY